MYRILTTSPTSEPPVPRGRLYEKIRIAEEWEAGLMRLLSGLPPARCPERPVGVKSVPTAVETYIPATRARITISASTPPSPSTSRFEITFAGPRPQRARNIHATPRRGQPNYTPVAH